MERSVRLAVSIGAVSLGLVLGGTACSSSPSGPVAANVVASPEQVVVINPDLAHALKVPANPAPAQVYTFTADNLLKYDFQLQNSTNQEFAVRVKSTWYNEQGAVSFDPPPFRYSFTQYEIKSITLVAANKDCRKLRVQVQLAN